MPGMLVVTRMFPVSAMSGVIRVGVELGRCVQRCTGGTGMGGVSALLLIVVLPVVISPVVRMQVIMSHGESNSRTVFNLSIATATGGALAQFQFHPD